MSSLKCRSVLYVRVYLRNAAKCRRLTSFFSSGDQAWIEDERLYIQTELCETSLEKQLESGHRLEISGVYAFLRQTLLGLDILHQHHLVHLDIKVGFFLASPE